MEASNLSTLSRCINILLRQAYADCQSGRTIAIACHVSFAQITCNTWCYKKFSEISWHFICSTWHLQTFDEFTMNINRKINLNAEDAMK